MSNGEPASLASNSSLCEECGEPATQWTLRDPFGKSDATRPLCGKHGPRIRDPADVAEIERLTRRVAELQQFHDWAEPQIHDHGRDVLTIERLTRERDEAREAYTDENLHKHGLIGKYGRLRAALAELLACKALREKIDGELSACHQEMSPQLQALENEYQLRKPLAWRDARAALSGEPTSAVETAGEPWKVGDTWHCRCGAANTAERCTNCKRARADEWGDGRAKKASAECQGCKEGWDRQGPWHWDSIGHMHKCTAQNGNGE